MKYVSCMILKGQCKVMNGGGESDQGKFSGHFINIHLSHINLTNRLLHACREGNRRNILISVNKGSFSSLLHQASYNFFLAQNIKQNFVSHRITQQMRYLFRGCDKRVEPCMGWEEAHLFKDSELNKGWEFPVRWDSLKSLSSLQLQTPKPPFTLTHSQSHPEKVPTLFRQWYKPNNFSTRHKTSGWVKPTLQASSFFRKEDAILPWNWRGNIFGPFKPSSL